MTSPAQRRMNDAGGSPTNAPASTPASTTYVAPNAPAWWKGAKAGDVQTDIANAVLPYLSAEDQANLKGQLAKSNTTFSGYGTATVAAPTMITPELRSSFLGQGRAQQAATALQNVAATYGGSPQMGTGFTFLQSAIDLLNKFGGSTGAMSREAYQSFLAESNALLASAKNDTALAPYASLATMFLNPTFSAGELNPVQKTKSGTNIYGLPSGKLYT